MDTLIIIPARLDSTRLPNKMLADIDNKPLIINTFESVKLADAGDIVVACDGEEIAKIITDAGGLAIITDPSIESGTDRIYAAYQKLNKSYKYIVNLQGDLPFISKDFINETLNLLKKSKFDITTAATLISDDSFMQNSVVKPIISFDECDQTIGEALYFSRAPVPFGGPYYHHIGIYCFLEKSLEKFVSLKPSKLEKQEKLEQLRALENDISIGVKIINKTPPISVDTIDDLEKVRKQKNSN